MIHGWPMWPQAPHVFIETFEFKITFINKRVQCLLLQHEVYPVTYYLFALVM